jgi:hypothetical protein
MRSSTRRSRKMGPPGLVEKKPLYVQLMKEGHSNRAACKILGINPNTGHRWLHGRNGVEGLVQQGLDPRPRKAVPSAAVSGRYLSEDERIFIADRLLVGASLGGVVVVSGASCLRRGSPPAGRGGHATGPRPLLPWGSRPTRGPARGRPGRPGEGRRRLLRADAPKPPGHRPFLLVFGAVTGEPAPGPDPGDGLVHAGKASGEGAGFGNSGGAVCGFESRVLAAGDDQVVPDEGGMRAHQLSDALPAQSEPVHQHPFRVRSAP